MADIPLDFRARLVETNRRELVDRVAELIDDRDPVQVATGMVLAALMNLDRKSSLMVMTQVRVELARAFYGDGALDALEASDARVNKGRTT